MAIGHRRGWGIATGIAVALAGSLYFAGPWILKDWAVEKLSKATGRPVTIEHLSFNPFTATVSLTQLNIGNNESPIIHVDKGRMTLAWRTLWQSGIHVEQVDLQEPLLRLVRTREGLNIAQLGGGGGGESTALSIAQIRAHDGKIIWINQTRSPSTQLSVTGLALTLEGYDSQASSPMQGEATGTLEGGQLSVQGQFGLSPLTGDLQVKGEGIGLALVNPWLKQFSNVQIKQGILNPQGTLAFGKAKQGRVQWQGNLGMSSIALLDGRQRLFFSVDQARLEGMDLLTGDHLRADRLSMSGSRMRAIIDEDGSFNLTTSLGLQSDRSSTQDGSTRQDGAQQDDDMALALGHMKVSEGVFHFEDRHMSPRVTLDVESLEGTMQDFDTRQNTPTSYAFKGLESQQTPVTIEGKFNAAAPSGVMHLVVDRLPLERFAPYIQRFGGYRIEQGIADLDLHYRLHDGRLEASNHVVLHHLDLGEAVPEGDTSLPLKNLIAVLQGEDGVINLDIPIDASVEGAGVDVSEVVWQIIGEALENMVTSPLETLDAMINGGDDDDNGKDRAERASRGYTEGPLSQVVTKPSDD